jgi:Ran GTPase-activating protein (RanGAP) involved in mRNA processing and transport
MVVAQINLAGNNLCGVYEDWFGRVQGTYTAEGIKAIADSIAVMTSLTSINLGFNSLGPEGAKALAPAIRDSTSMTVILS